MPPVNPISIRNKWYKQTLCTMFLILVATILVYADEKNDSTKFHDWRIAASVHTGFILNHHNNMRILGEQHLLAGELLVAKRTHGEMAWHSFFNYPEYGLSMIIMDVGSPTYIGKAYGLSPFINFYLFNNSGRLNLAIKVGAGAAYVEKIFNRHTNYKNVALGSHVNAFLNLQLNGTLRISERISAAAGVEFAHFSNGTFKKPNAGVNAITFSAGGSYAFGKSNLLRPQRISTEISPQQWNYRLYLSGGVKEISPIGGLKYLASGLSLEISKQHLSYTRFGGTVDIFYDFSDYVSLQRSGEEVNRIQTIKPGVTAGYELLFGKISTTLQAGVYLYAKNTEYGITYQRFALRYAVNSRLNVQVGLKSQQGQADYIEMACGYRLR